MSGINLQYVPRTKKMGQKKKGSFCEKEKANYLRLPVFRSISRHERATKHERTPLYAFPLPRYVSSQRAQSVAFFALRPAVPMVAHRDPSVAVAVLTRAAAS
jgi:hypothetical protein